jgi:hypothetical protein
LLSCLGTFTCKFVMPRIKPALINLDLPSSVLNVSTSPTTAILQRSPPPPPATSPGACFPLGHVWHVAKINRTACFGAKGLDQDRSSGAVALQSSCNEDCLRYRAYPVCLPSRLSTSRDSIATTVVLYNPGIGSYRKRACQGYDCR